jgi:hypothetical protein
MSPIFQPLCMKTPIGRLVQARARALRLSRTDLVRRLGFARLQTGHTTLTALLITGRTTPTIAAKLADALEVEPNLFDAVLVATAQQRHGEAGARGSWSDSVPIEIRSGHIPRSKLSARSPHQFSSRRFARRRDPGSPAYRTRHSLPTRKPETES